MENKREVLKATIHASEEGIPIIHWSFISQTRMVANAWLRPGNTADNSNSEAFLEETYEKIRKEQEVGLLRADGFYTDKILSYLESRKQNYIIAVRMYPNIKSMIYGIDDWVEICNGIEVNQMHFSHTNKKERRYTNHKVVFGK